MYAGLVSAHLCRCVGVALGNVNFHFFGTKKASLSKDVFVESEMLVDTYRVISQLHFAALLFWISVV